VENATEDSIRLEKLKEKIDQIKYETKPKLNESKLYEQLKAELDREKAKRMEAKNATRTRTRSLSSSGNLEKFLANNKYANVKAKTQTRLPPDTARLASEEDQLSNSRLNSSKRDTLNDSSSIRQSIYNEWYVKKMEAAKADLKESQLKQRDEEERKAQELIEKLQKSRLVFKIWNQNKEETLKEKQKQTLQAEQKKKELEEEKRNKKKDAELAFREWSRQKTEYLQEKKQEALDAERKKQRQKRKENQTKVEAKKPPVPYDTW
jgi:hypothetical protein